MATATAIAPEEQVIVVTKKKVPSTKSREFTELVRSMITKNKKRMKRAIKASKKASKWGWGWLSRKAKKAYRWAMRASKAFALWNLKIAKQTRTYITGTAVGVWEYTRPFRGWVATPFRLALGTTSGLAALLTFGTRNMILLTVPWVVFLLVSGRMVMVKKSTVKKQKRVIRAQSKRVIELEDIVRGLDP